jgi:hypothetical protein
MNYTEYIAKGGDRWDLVAFYAYGDATKFPEIINANPTVPISVTIPAGTRLLVPVIQTTTATPPQSALPPWKR